LIDYQLVIYEKRLKLVMQNTNNTIQTMIARSLVFLFFSILFTKNMLAQPARDWDKAIGGGGWDELHFTKKMSDGGFLLGGNAAGQGGGDVGQPLAGSADFWLVRTDKNGIKIWDKTFGGTDEDKLWAIEPLPDGGWMLAGHSASGVSGSKATDGFGKSDFWLIRLNQNFDKIWEKSFGGSGDDLLFSFNRLENGDFILAGFSDSPADGLKTTAPKGGFDWWVLRINLAGDIVWQKSFGGNGLDNLYNSVFSKSGNILLGGSSDSGIDIGGDFSELCRGQIDYWVVEMNASNGDLVREKRFGGAERDQMQQILPLSDGNYLLLGGSASKKEKDRTAPSFGFFDDWIIKVRPDFSEIWQKSYGGSGFDHLYRGLETIDGGLLLAGTSDSPVSGNHTSAGFGNYDFWLVYADSTGEMRWNKSYGGAAIDAVTDLVQTDDNFAILLAGHSLSGESGFHSEETKGLNDFWLLKTACSISSNLPLDTLICSKYPLDLDAQLTGCSGNDCQIFWENGDTSEQTIYRPEAFGFFSFLAIDGNSCGHRDSILVEITPSPALDLGQDSTLFIDQIWSKNLQSSEIATYGWSTGSALPSVQIDVEAEVSVILTGNNGCISFDTVKICPCKKRNVYIPNIFSPNRNLFNDRFYVFADPAAVTEITRLTVFNRFGVQVFNRENFQPNDPNFGWDGLYRGRRLDPNVFMYEAQILMSNGKTEQYLGSLTLIR
jgi:gliding motility-associated-like protein